MEIKIEDYLSNEEIKEIAIEQVKRSVKSCLGDASVDGDRGRQLMVVMAKTMAKDGIQEMIPNFKELLNEHIQESIKNIKLSDMFLQSFGWQSTGNKILNEVLSANKPLIDAKVKEIFKTVDK